MKKWIKRIVLSLLLIIALGVVWAYFWLGSSAPQYRGELQLSGLQQKVDVHFDEFGVPHIYAQNKHDLYMAFGYVHAQDRLFQMEMLRRAGSGRLSEIIGRPVLKVDKMFRSLGLVEYAKESAAYLESQKGTAMYSDVQAYLDGINYFISNGATPPEFSVIGIEKTPYTFEDLYCATGAMAFSFSMAHKTEPVIDFIDKKYGHEYLEDLGLWHDSTESFIPTTNHLEATPPQKKSLQQEEHENEMEDETEASGEIMIGGVAEEAMLEFSLAMQQIEDALPFAPMQGSNAWAVSGKKTKSGEVIFCNDTHIGYMIPQTWYEAHLVCPDYEMYGHHFAGVPFALIGRNRQLSWGVTMLENDEMDFYTEKFASIESNKYEHKGEWKEAEVRSYTIKIKGEADTTIQVRYTTHGPVVNDAFEGMSDAAPLSMYWTFTKFPNRTLDALYGMNNSQNMIDFQSHLASIHAPGLSINYGDKEGNIAWWACAALIERPRHVNSWTLLDGASGKDDAIGFYPFELNPRNVNPECGYIYSANDWPQDMSTNNPSDSAIWIPGYYKPQYRANRITQLLASSNDWDMSSMQTVMCDVTNVMDSSLLNWFWMELDSVDEYRDSVHFRQYDELFQWTGQYDPRLAQPTFFNKMLYHYLHLTIADEIGEDRFNLFMQTHQWQRTYSHLFKQEDSPWWDVKGTYEIETRRDIIYKAFCKSLDDLRDEWGDNPKVWTWQKASTCELKHPLGEVAVFKPLFNIGPNGVWGGNETIMQAGFKLDSTGHYKISYGSQMRIIVDFVNVDSTQNVTPVGQSGHIMSDHYRDQADMYRNKKFRTAWMGKARIQKFEKLELVP